MIGFWQNLLAQELALALEASAQRWLAWPIADVRSLISGVARNLLAWHHVQTPFRSWSDFVKFGDRRRSCQGLAPALCFLVSVCLLYEGMYAFLQTFMK